MNNQAPTQAFEMAPILEAIKPLEALEKIVNRGRIIKLNWDTTIDKIIVILDITWYQTGSKVCETEVIVINHDDFQAWLQENSRLQLDLGEIDDPHIHYLGYTEYMMEHVDSHDLADYIAANELVPVGLTWTHPKPTI